MVTTAHSRVGMTFGKYELTALLGKGGMGEVYKAYDSDKGRTVALKILTDQYAHNDQFRTRFLRESRAAAILQEPHVIPIHDWGEIDGNLYIDMRLVQGQTLYDLLKRGPLQPERAVAIIQQVAAALDAAHAEGLIHRDVKPQNIIVTPADFAYLLDFGIAEAKGDTRLTTAGAQVGSFAYMAPERFNDEASTPAVDVYSLACVLYEALTRETPFSNDSLEHLIAAHISAPPPRPSAAAPGIPPALDDVISRGMAKEPDERYGSAGALGRAAQRALQTTGRSAAPSANTMAGPYTNTMAGPYANTMAGPYASWPPSAAVPPPVSVPPPISVPPGLPPFGPTTGPTAVQGRGADDRSRMLPIVVIGIVAALLLGAMGVMVGLLVSKNSGQTAGPAATTPYAASTPGYPVPGTTVYQTVTPSSSQQVPSSSTPAPAIDPESASLAQLQQLAAGDRAYVSTQLADRWVPQLSSKRPGVVDDGVVWNNALTLQEHQRLRQRYNAKLLWSGDWSVFDESNYWVTIVPVPFSSAEDALRWCSGQGFDADHCYAKLVSTTHPVAGSTAHN